MSGLDIPETSIVNDNSGNLITIINNDTNASVFINNSKVVALVHLGSSAFSSYPLTLGTDVPHDSLNNLTNVSISSPTSNEVLIYNGTDWSNALVSNSSLSGPIVSSITAGTGISVSNPSGVGAATVTNTGIISASAGSGISVSGTNPLTITNTGVLSVSNSDGSLTISPTTGVVVASINTGHANTWTVEQLFNANVILGQTGPLGFLQLSYNDGGNSPFGSSVTQGGYITWNLSSGAGATAFVNQYGGGSGGFEFYTITSTGTLSSILFNIESSGLVGTKNNTLDNGSGNMTIAGIITANAGITGTGNTGSLTAGTGILNTANTWTARQTFDGNNVILFEVGSYQTTVDYASSAGSYFLDANAGDFIIRNETNNRIALGFAGVSGLNASIILTYPYSVQTGHNTLDDGSGNMTIAGKLTDYDGVNSVGFGVGLICGVDVRTGITTADASAKTLYTVPAAGQTFRLTARIYATAGSASANYQVTWTENGFTVIRNLSVTAIDVPVELSSEIIQPDNGTKITAQITSDTSTTVNVASSVERIA